MYITSQHFIVSFYHNLTQKQVECSSSDIKSMGLSFNKPATNPGQNNIKPATQ